MNSSNGNEWNLATKHGLIARALLSDRKIVILLISFGLALDSANWFFNFVLYNTSHFMTVSLIIYGTQQAIYSVFMFSLCYRKDKYIDIFTRFESCAKLPSNHSSVDAFMRRNRYIFHLYMFINFLINICLLIAPFIDQFIKSKVNTFDALKFGLMEIGCCCSFALIRFFVEACLYIHTCFMRVEQQIDILNKSSNLLSIGDIRKVRRLYCFAVETTEKFNSLLWPVISSYFVVCIVKSHFALADAIAAASLTYILICVGEFSIFIIVAYNMIYINHLSTRIYQSVYSLAYKTDSLFAKKEVHLFLTRIERGDVGFLDLFVITPTCVSTLATISLTLALAEPTFIK